MAKNFDNYHHLLRDEVVILLKLPMTKKLFLEVLPSYQLSEKKKGRKTGAP